MPDGGEAPGPVPRRRPETAQPTPGAGSPRPRNRRSLAGSPRAHRATWNIDVPAPDLLLAWLDKAQPDVVCLQELKCDAAAVPTMPLLAAGYEVAAHAEGRWNGVRPC